ncbi:MAG: hypothetical protein L7S47_08635 [Acidimicrobiales bacterium]|jgi:hypothetical protein|nr:hypothetical protein [Acidimicrobiales bacterium]
MDLLFIFEWLDASILADMSKAYGGVFAMVQVVHLVALAMLGGAVLVSDLRLLGVLLTDVSSESVVNNMDRWFSRALIVIAVSGVFMSSAVAIKLYYNEMFWAKMIGLSFGAAFVYFVRRPLLRHPHQTINVWSIRLIAVSSMIIWFTVAASGRWIGFS